MTVDILPPGPRLPVAVQTAAWITRPWQLMERCAARYGDAFTLRLVNEHPWVVVSSPDAIKDVFTGPSELLRAGEGNRFLLPVLGLNSVVLLEDDAHREQRRLLTPPFRGNHLHAYADTISAVAATEVTHWPRGEPVRLHSRMRALTLEIMLRVVFGFFEGERLNQLRAELVRLESFAFLGQVLLFALGSKRQLPPLPRHPLFTRVDRLLYAEIDDRRHAADSGGHHDVLSILLQARHEDGLPMSDVEIRDELMTLLVAGNEPTATALAWCVERLVRHPRLLARLTEEIHAGSHEFLDAVIKETLRLRPVVSLVTRRLTAPMRIGGLSLPAEVIVTPSIYLVHRRPDIYPEPLRFRPERFLEQPARTYTWIPFGGGSRRCLAAAFVEYEMRIILATLLASCTIDATNKRNEPARRRTVVHVPGRGATVVLR